MRGSKNQPALADYALYGAGHHPRGGPALEEVPAGLHQLHCLPLKIIGSDGAPVRCILTVS